LFEHERFKIVSNALQLKWRKPQAYDAFIIHTDIWTVLSVII